MNHQNDDDEDLEEGEEEEDGITVPLSLCTPPDSHKIPGLMA